MIHHFDGVELWLILHWTPLHCRNPISIDSVSKAVKFTRGFRMNELFCLVFEVFHPTQLFTGK